MTYGDLQSRIADEISDTALTTQIRRAIQSAIAFYERERFYFNTRTTDTFNTVANQEYYGSSDLAAIPNLIRIFWMKYTLSSVQYPIVVMDNSLITEAQNGQATGDPSNFSYTSQKIRLFPIPTAVRVITMATQYRLTTLSADADTNAWVEDAEELIRCHAKMILARDVTNDDRGVALMATAIPPLLKALKRETRMRRSNDFLRMPELAQPPGYDIRTG